MFGFTKQVCKILNSFYNPENHFFKKKNIWYFFLKAYDFLQSDFCKVRAFIKIWTSQKKYNFAQKMLYKKWSNFLFFTKIPKIRIFWFFLIFYILGDKNPNINQNFADELWFKKNSGFCKKIVLKMFDLNFHVKSNLQ